MRYQPHNFTPARDVISAKKLQCQPPFITRTTPRGAKAVGVRYEKRALDKLERLLEGREGVWLRSPWLEFVDSSGRRWCQPDGVFLEESLTAGIVFEIKYRHCAEAWFQLWQLYIPVLEKVFPGVRFNAVEMVKWLDPATSFPERYALAANPLIIPQQGITAVHVWNPQRDHS